MIKPFIVCVFAICFLFAGCSNELGREEYIHWIQDHKNGLHVTKNQSSFIFDLQYQPSDYTFLLRDDNFLVADEGLQYYVLKVSTQDPSKDILTYNIETVSEMKRRYYYYAYLFQQDIFLEENGKKLPCILFHFEQSDLDNTRAFILAFENYLESEVKETRLVIDSEQFGSFPVKINISKQNVPRLKI